MFGIGFFEFCIIAVVALVFVGPKHLPELMQQFGKFFVHMRRMSNEVKSSMDDVIHSAEAELRAEEQAKKKSLALKPTATAPEAAPVTASTTVATAPADQLGESWQAPTRVVLDSSLADKDPADSDPLARTAWQESGPSDKNSIS